MRTGWSGWTHRHFDIVGALGALGLTVAGVLGSGGLAIAVVLIFLGLVMVDAP